VNAPVPALGGRRPVALELIDLHKSFGPMKAVEGVGLKVRAGSLLSLIGPSGCGKTTTLRMIAGLERPDSGRITADGRLLTDGPHGIPPEQRDMGMVFQSYALWPHMTVEENVAYGLRRRRRAAVEIAPKVRDTLELVGMGLYAARYPAQLSGGQQQRVALARAIATEPGILLFDEPLSNLDAVMREQMRFEVRALQQRLGITSVYVTHSQDEALSLSDEIAVMRDGAIVQRGTPLALYSRPRNAFVAGFVGLANILKLDGLRPLGDGVAGCLADGTEICAGVVPAGTAGRASACVCARPSDIRMDVGAPPAGGGVNRIGGQIRSTSFTGGLVDHFVVIGNGLEVRVQALPPPAAEPGTLVTLVIPPERVVLLED
jgi:ABC-type Fe3+/spermidine/putrescine transport system ATPase subunit